VNEAPMPVAGRLAGIDFGTVRVGIAVSDPGQRIASPWETYVLRGSEVDARHFQGLAEEEQLVGFVVGLPVHMSGDESQKSREARRFGAWLAAATGLPVCFHDERLSTREADGLLAAARAKARRHRALRDMLAAQVILSSYLGSSRGAAPEPLDD